MGGEIPTPNNSSQPGAFLLTHAERTTIDWEDAVMTLQTDELFGKVFVLTNRT